MDANPVLNKFYNPDGVALFVHLLTGFIPSIL